MPDNKALAIERTQRIPDDQQQLLPQNFAAWKQIAGGILLLSIEATLFGCLIVFGQRGPDVQSCAVRATNAGFVGNPDFYGLGIRVGMYLQWTATMITRLALPADLYDVFIPGIIFALAQAVALVVLLCQRTCTYTAEIFVLGTLLWTGIYILDVPGWTATGALFKRASLGVAGLTWALTLPALLWFLGRMVVYGERDFAATPGGTVGFLFSRVGTGGLGAACAVVLALLCFRLTAGVLSVLLAGCRVVRLRIAARGLESVLSLWKGLIWALHLPFCRAHLLVRRLGRHENSSTEKLKVKRNYKHVFGPDLITPIYCSCRHL